MVRGTEESRAQPLSGLPGISSSLWLGPCARHQRDDATLPAATYISSLTVVSSLWCRVHGPNQRDQMSGRASDRELGHLFGAVCRAPTKEMTQPCLLPPNISSLTVVSSLWCLNQSDKMLGSIRQRLGHLTMPCAGQRDVSSLWCRCAGQRDVSSLWCRCAGRHPKDDRQRHRAHRPFVWL